MRNRSSLYAVVRFIDHMVEVEDDKDPDLSNYIGPAIDAQVVGVYSTLESADEMTGMYNQQVKEGKLPQAFSFETQVTTYYDE